MNEDPDIEILKAKKMQELMKRMMKQQQKDGDNKESDKKPELSQREIFLSYLYDRGDEVLSLAESQFPIETKAITNRIIELVNSGEIRSRISGGQLLALFRSVGLNIKVNTTIKIEEHGKYVSFAEKLKSNKENE